MNPLDTSAASPAACSIEELEARLEMEALGAPGVAPGTDWSCTCRLEF